jgi:hypothetical protein
MPRAALSASRCGWWSAMSRPSEAIVYCERHDATAETEIATLANVYRLVIESANQRGRLHDKSDLSDVKGQRNDSRQLKDTG